MYLVKMGSDMLCMALAMVDSPEDKRKIEQLYDTYNRLMYVTAYRILQHHEDAEDAVIASWEKIIRHLDKISEINCQKTVAYIVIIVERTAIDFYRSNKRRGKVQMLVDEYEESPFFLTKDVALEEVEMIDLFRSIPKKYGEVLLLHYVNQMTSKEIADVLEIKQATVEKKTVKREEND